MKILLVEDDVETATYIATGLSKSGHVVERAADGREALASGTAGSFDVMIVDRMLPLLDGLSVLKTLRAAGVDTPVLVLSTLGGINDRVSGLDAGGDDYLVKPFALVELLARVHALGRRSPNLQSAMVLRVADLELDLVQRSATRAGQSIALQAREFKLLEFLMRHAGEVVTRSMLLEQVWEYNFDPKTTVVETHMSRLRNKIDKGFSRELIQTVRGAGYCLGAPA